MPSSSDLPVRPDLAVLAVKNERLEETLRDRDAIGAKAAVIFASGTSVADT